MKHPSKVVWSEGMYLGPHHFQAQSRAFEELVHVSTSNLWFEPSGLVGQSLDADALRNGTVALAHCRGIFRDGLAFHMPESDPLPSPRQIGDAFPPTRESLVVMLAVPALRENGPNCAMTADQDRDHLRYAAEARTLYDENTGVDEKPVHLGRKSIRFLFESEDAAGYTTMPIGRMVRDGAGHYVYDPSFIPPCLHISASERLMIIARRLVEILDEKSSVLSRARRAPSKYQAGFSSDDIAAFWFVHTVNASLSVLRHICVAERKHPEQLFLEMSKLAGALCTFGIDSHPRTLPLYDHWNLSECFQKLDEHIRAHLELVIPTSYVVIQLKPVGRYFYQGEITDQRCVGRARWIFAIHSGIGESDLIARTPRLVKICSGELLPELVKTALPGLALTHLPVPPSAIAPRVEHQYFGVSKSGTCWEHIVQTRKVGVYVPGDLPDPELELVVLPERN
jgi:type VI secretion system protein ImpJ